jgi:hypothetical protein
VNWGLSLALSGEATVAAQKIREGSRLSAACGDRRREAQGEVFLAVAHALTGDLSESSAGLRRGAEMLKAQGDGRWFAPTLAWLLHLRNEPCDRYPPAPRPVSLRRPSKSCLLTRPNIPSSRSTMRFGASTCTLWQLLQAGRV